MAIAAPPRPPTQNEPEALIPEARDRQQRRRLLVGAAILFAAALGLSVYAVVSNGKPRTVQTHDGRPSVVGTPPRCRAAQLHLSQGFGGVAAGSSEAIFTFRNMAAHDCVLRGWPLVRLESASGRLMSVRTTHALALQPRQVEMRPGAMASFGVADSYGGYFPLCPSSSAVLLTPPGDRASVSVISSLPDCIRRSTYWSLVILPLVPGRTDHQPW